MAALDDYITRFGRLHTDKNKRWTQRLNFRAPHKPLVLFSVLDRFAEGMLTVSTDYLVNASPRLRADQNVPAHLAALDGRGMIRPGDVDYWPAAESLNWHLEHVFRRR